MKNIRITFIAAIAAAATALTACDDDRSVTVAQLPQPARDFLTEYFNGQQAGSAAKDGDKYDIILDSGVDIEFDANGQWTQVDAPDGGTIPTGYIPELIEDFIAANYPTTSVNEVTRKRNRYEIELNNGLELRFNLDGSYAGMDK